MNLPIARLAREIRRSVEEPLNASKLDSHERHQEVEHHQPKPRQLVATHGEEFTLRIQEKGGRKRTIGIHFAAGEALQQYIAAAGITANVAA